MGSTTLHPVISASNIMLKHDQPRSLAEWEALKNLKSEINEYIISNNVDDYFLLRFLRARGMNILKAKEMLQNYFEFRKTNKYFLDICKKSYFPNEFIFRQKIQCLKTFDLDGRPAFIVKAGNVNHRETFETLGKDEFLRWWLYWLEYLLHLSEKQRMKHGCTKIVAIADLDGMCFRNIFFPQSVSTGIYIVRTIESCYPELLHMAIAINANWVFHTGYKIIKPFLSQETQEKVQICGHDPNTWNHALKKYLPESSIPEEYGGTGPPLTYAQPEIFEGFSAQH